LWWFKPDKLMSICKHGPDSCRSLSATKTPFEYQVQTD
jgi:hypothetical protein